MSKAKYVFIRKSAILPNQNETLAKEVLVLIRYSILAKFRHDWVKIVDFLIKSYF